MAAPAPCRESAAVVQVIKTEFSRGDGSEGNPVRVVVQYWTFNGDLIADIDPARS